MNKTIICLLALCLLFTGCTFCKTAQSSETLADTEFLPKTSDAAGELTEGSSPEPMPVHSKGQIWLYGKNHSDPKCLKKELEIWDTFYAEGMRDLFIEFPFYTAELLNEWMHADSNQILNDIYWDWNGTQAYSTDYLQFLRQIKKDYPETVFHGTDVGHQYKTTGKRYLDALKAAGKEGSAEYARAAEIIEQGKRYYKALQPDYRENCMAANFIWEFDKLGDKDVMAIYGAAHTDPYSLDHSGRVDSMAKQLFACYGEALHIKDLRYADPIRTDRIVIRGKEYEATYFGRMLPEDYGPNAEFPDGIQYLDFWILENAYDDFRSCPSVLYDGQEALVPFSQFPMKITEGQIIRIEGGTQDGAIGCEYYCSDGTVYQGMPVARQIEVRESEDE